MTTYELAALVQRIEAWATDPEHRALVGSQSDALWRLDDGLRLLGSVVQQMDALKEGSGVNESEALVNVCPTCNVELLLAWPDVSVPTYPVYSDIPPVAEYRCPCCGHSFVRDGAVVRRTATVLAALAARKNKGAA